MNGKKSVYISIFAATSAKNILKVLKIERIKVCHGSLTVKTLARKAGDPWFES